MQAIKKALEDLSRSLSRKDLWIYLGWFDIRQRYKRSLLGPWWITLSTGLFVMGLALLWSNIFGMKLSEYMPYFVVAHIVWTFIATSVADTSNGLIQFEHIIKQINIPYSSYILRVVYRNVIILFHNVVIVLVVFSVFPESIDLNLLNLLAAVANLFVFIFFLGIILSIACLRFRDLQQVVSSGMAALFFITPIVWRPGSVSGRMKLLIELNPIAWYISNIRDALLCGNEAASFLPAISVTLIAIIISLYMLGTCKSKIPYWL